MTIEKNKLESLKKALAAFEAKHGTVSYTPQTASNCYGSCGGRCQDG
jgi:hypothetical protein